MTATAIKSEPLLRTLAPALRHLEKSLAAWMDSPRRYPLSFMAKATLEGLSNDLKRSGEALDVDRPHLVILLMGGTGVGKSTLLNALAGGAVAQASFLRPTTRDPVVYHHSSLNPQKLDPALQLCRLAMHDRPALEQKILVDTPDLDSNDLSNREKLARLLPLADIVLYVGSQEKYHDQLGWELFLEQRRRRAFAFVLNKWDRCLHGSGGLRPDEDLLRDLREQGFQDPLLFRTCAQLWLDREAGGPHEPPPGEQFAELVEWLERGLSRLEIEAIKARGVAQLLQQLDDTLDAACPPDLHEIALKTRVAWRQLLQEETTATADILLNSLDPYQREIEHHFTLEGQQRFRGIMATYLHLATRLRYVGSTLRSRIPLLVNVGETQSPAPSWDLAQFTRTCSVTAAERHLDARRKALANRLLVEADTIGFPLSLLGEATEAATQLDWRQRHANTMGEVLQEIESSWTQPSGLRGLAQKGVHYLGEYVPPAALVASLILMLWRLVYQQVPLTLTEILLPPVLLLIVLVLLHFLILWVLPFRWAGIRGEFQRRLEKRQRQELEEAYLSVPGQVADSLREERERAEQLLHETREVRGWLEEREHAASIAGLYGKN